MAETESVPSTDKTAPASPIQPAKLSTEPEQQLHKQKTIAKEVIKEVAKELTEQEKNNICLDKLRKMISLANKAKRARHEKRLTKIIQYIQANGFITNDDVERITKLSHRSASRYLKELQKRGVVKLEEKTSQISYKFN